MSQMGGKIDPVSGLTIPLSALDQAMSQLYGRHFVCFPYDDNRDKGQTVSILKEGLLRTMMSLPFLAAEVVPAEGPKKGWVELKSGRDIEFIVKDLADSPIWTKSYAELDVQKMPISELDGDILAPCGIWPTPGSRAPVIAIQANFIKGGLILCLCPHHSVLDAVAFGTLWRIWAQNCRDVPESDGGKGRLCLTGAVVDKRALLEVPPSAKIYDPVAPPITPAEKSTLNTLPPRKLIMLHFSTTSLAKLKSDVSSSYDISSGTDKAQAWISTNDALSALLWCCINNVRHTRHLSEGTADLYPRSTLGMAVNVRSKINPPFPANFLGGNMILYAKPQRAMNRAPSLHTVSKAAREIRTSVSMINDRYIRSVIASIESLPDVTDLPEAFFPNHPETDLPISSWADLPLYDLDWGRAIGSKAAYVRLPKGQLVRFCIVLPRLLDGSLEVLLSQRTDDIDCLMRDELIARYATVYWQNPYEAINRIGKPQLSSKL